MIFTSSSSAVPGINVNSPLLIKYKDYKNSQEKSFQLQKKNLCPKQPQKPEFAALIGKNPAVAGHVFN